MAGVGRVGGCRGTAARRAGWTACLVLLAGGAVAAEGQGSAADAAPAAQQRTASEDAELADKLSAYIDCINQHSNWTLGSRNRYYSWLKSPAKGPTGRERVVYGVYPLHDPAGCVAGIGQAARMPPQLPDLQDVASRWADALVHARTVVTEANDYYELENYKDDRMTRGKALHPRLVEAFDAFDTANDAFYAGVVAQQEALAERRLERLADDPQRRGEYLRAHTMDRARKVLDSARGIGGKDFAPEPLAAAGDESEASWRAFDAWIDANPQDAVADMHARMFLDGGFALLKSAKALVRKERDGFRFSSGERMLIEDGSGEMIEGHPDHMVEHYNRFIDAANR